MKKDTAGKVARYLALTALAGSISLYWLRDILCNHMFCVW